MSLARLWLATALALAGCSGYRLGTGQGAPRDIELAPVRNAAVLPGAHAVLHQSLAAALAADQRLRLGTGGDRLEVEVVDVERVAATRSTSDALLSGQLRVTLVVHGTLRSADGRQTRFANRPFSASAILPTSGDIAREERAAMPRLCAEVAAKVRDAAAGSW